MTQFTADIAGMLEIFAIAAGLVLLHVASKEQSSTMLLKSAAWILIIGGVGVGLCTIWFWFQFTGQGTMMHTMR